LASSKRDEHFDMRALMRLSFWGSGAALALLLAVIAAGTEKGSLRLAAALNPSAQVASASSKQLAARPAGPDSDTRRLSEQLRSLSTDRDRLLARVTVLERNLEDVTGSIGRQAARASESPAEPPMPPLPGPTVAATIANAPMPPPRPDSAPRSANAAPLAHSPASEATSIKTDFAIDIGGGTTLDALRELWASVKGNHPNLVAGLRPVIAVRDGARPGTIELRIVAGPLPNAAAASRLCASFAASGWACRPAPFEGQRLAVQ
jgi:hypothetical protein